MTAFLIEQMLINPSRFNSGMTANRRRNLEGTYEPHSNFTHYPKIMQPTHVRWERVPTPLATEDSLVAYTNGQDSSLKMGADAKLRKVGFNGGTTSTGTVHRTLGSQHDGLDPFVRRNYMVMDTRYTGPPISNLGVPGPDGDEYDIGPNGVAIVPHDMMALIPEECLRPFLETREVQRRWKKSWGTEEEDCARAELRFGYSSAP